MNTPSPSAPRVPKSRFRLGIAFLVLNYAFGWPFLLIVESLALYFKDPSLGMLGAIGYGISWVFLGIALWLAGPGVVEWSKRQYGRWRGNPNGEEIT